MSGVEGLKPCPFCGCEAEFSVVDDLTSPDYGGHFIQCKNALCCGSVGLIYAAGDDPKPLLAERWNRRAPAEGGVRELVEEAFIAGALSVHEYWTENPGEAPRGDPEFDEEASDYALSAIEGGGFGSRPQEAVVPTEQADGGVVGDRVWVDIASQGEYSDRSEWCVEAHTTEAAGQAAVERLDAEDRAKKVAEKRAWYCDDVTYYLSEVPLLAAPASDTPTRDEPEASEPKDAARRDEEAGQ